MMKWLADLSFLVFLIQFLGCTSSVPLPSNSVSAQTQDLCNMVSGSYADGQCTLGAGRDFFTDQQVNGCNSSGGVPSYLQTTCDTGSFEDSDCQTGTYNCPNGAGIKRSVVHCVCPTSTCWNDMQYTCEQAST